MTNNYTDTQLKQSLAKMLPELLENYYQDTPLDNFLLSWTRSKREVLNTELLHLCWLVELEIDDKTRGRYYIPELVRTVEERFWYPEIATWQQRVIALAKVKGVEIV